MDSSNFMLDCLQLTCSTVRVGLYDSSDRLSF